MTCSFLRAKQPELGLLQQLGVYTLDKNDLLCLHCIPPPLSATGKRIVVTEKTLGVPRNSLENHTRHLSIQKNRKHDRWKRPISWSLCLQDEGNRHHRASTTFGVHKEATHENPSTAPITPIILALASR
ncbi:hypothetical protein SLA2020_381170 [Shorea laevis]